MFFVAWLASDTGLAALGSRCKQPEEASYRGQPVRRPKLVGTVDCTIRLRGNHPGGKFFLPNGWGASRCPGEGIFCPVGS